MCTLTTTFYSCSQIKSRNVRTSICGTPSTCVKIYAEANNQIITVTQPATRHPPLKTIHIGIIFETTFDVVRFAKLEAYTPTLRVKCNLESNENESYTDVFITTIQRCFKMDKTCKLCPVLQGFSCSDILTTLCDWLEPPSLIQLAYVNRCCYKAVRKKGNSLFNVGRVIELATPWIVGDVDRYCELLSSTKASVGGDLARSAVGFEVACYLSLQIFCDDITTMMDIALYFLKEEGSNYFAGTIPVLPQNLVLAKELNTKEMCDRATSGKPLSLLKAGFKCEVRLRGSIDRVSIPSFGRARYTSSCVELAVWVSDNYRPWAAPAMDSKEWLKLRFTVEENLSGVK